ncbi:hypothetical protein HYALB_00010347 [Hymenoscyphus albidus]|uniref:Uncharacterized protein n=1 Tax=Hymenoscyphus albidus TaxID=595503 RepID=A0A9N9Q3Y5_9HELO|nr:hypothetical protein HYALB_00010347 [Hymenoscyphus albidus]
MTGKFSEKDQERCNHYARFMRNLTLLQANCIFWILFTLVLFMMCLSSFQHHRIIDLEKGMPPEQVQSPEYKQTVQQKRKGYFAIVMICFWVAFTSIIFECFAAFNIQFCDGEDLIQLYWGFWSILQVGSLIAIVGVMVQFWIVLSGYGTPPWGVALGTPVLVFAAFIWVLRYTFKGAWKKARGRYMWGGNSDSDNSDEEGEKRDYCAMANRHMSRA